MTRSSAGRGELPPARPPGVEFPMREIEKARVRLRWLGRFAPFLASRIALRYFLRIRQHPRPALGMRLVFVAPPDDLHFFVGYFERLLDLSPRLARGFERRLEHLRCHDQCATRLSSASPSAKRCSVPPWRK